MTIKLPNPIGTMKLIEICPSCNGKTTSHGFEHDINCVEHLNNMDNMDNKDRIIKMADEMLLDGLEMVNEMLLDVRKDYSEFKRNSSLQLIDKKEVEHWIRLKYQAQDQIIKLEIMLDNLRKGIVK